jgi:hypothetical protein
MMNGYYERLEQSDLFKGKVVAYAGDKVGAAGDTLTHFQCSECGYVIQPFKRWNERYQRFDEVIDCNCPNCS